jgi:hypothetical protein
VLHAQPPIQIGSAGAILCSARSHNPASLYPDRSNPVSQRLQASE